MSKIARLVGEQWSWDSLVSEPGRVDITEELDHIHAVIRIDAVIREVAETSEELFWLGKQPGRGVYSSKLGKQLITCMNTDFEGIERAFPRHTLSPYFRLLKDAVREHAYSGYGLNWATYSVFNKIVYSLRHLANTALNKAIENQRRSSRKNSAGLLRCLEEIRERNSKVVAVRIDVGMSLPYRQGLPDGEVDPVYLKQCFARWLRYIERKFPTFLWYAGRLEYGPKKSFHGHFLLLFNGQDVRQDVTLGAIIGDHWSKVITEGNGTYFNCNAQKDIYRKRGKLGIGAISYHEGGLWTNLRNAALYLVKADYYARVNHPGVKRTFFRGVVKPACGTRRGRPRLINTNNARDSESEAAKVDAAISGLAESPGRRDGHVKVKSQHSQLR